MVRLHITFLDFTARNRCGSYNPVTPDISYLVLGVDLRCRRRINSTGTHSQYDSCSPHSCMLLRHGPASVRNLFSRLHWPRGRSIPGTWMVGH